MTTSTGTDSVASRAGYQAPTVTPHHNNREEINDLPAAVAAIGVVIAIWGSAWGFCKATCGWNNVAECDTRWWGSVKAVCKS